MEAAAIAKKFHQKLPSPPRTLHFPHNTCAIEIRVIGIGAIQMIQTLPKAAPPLDVIIMAGLAGALDPTLKIGDIVIDKASTWPETSLPHPRRKIHTSKTVISTTTEKSALFHQTHAAAVEMESTPVRQFAQLMNAKYLGIRSISDQANHPLNPNLLKCITPFGRPKLNIIYQTLRHPTLIKEFHRLNRDSNAALKTLSTAIESILKN